MTLIGINSSEVASAVSAIFVVVLVVMTWALTRRAAKQKSLEYPALRPERVPKLSSQGLSAMIVESLIESKLIARDKAAEAVSIAARKIDLRKALGDY